MPVTGAVPIWWIYLSNELLLCGFLLLPVGGDDGLGQNIYFPKIQSYHESGNIGIHVLAKFQLVLLIS